MSMKRYLLIQKNKQKTIKSSQQARFHANVSSVCACVRDSVLQLLLNFKGQSKKLLWLTYSSDCLKDCVLLDPPFQWIKENQSQRQERFCTAVEVCNCRCLAAIMCMCLSHLLLNRHQGLSSLIRNAMQVCCHRSNQAQVWQCQTQQTDSNVFK